MTQEEKELLLKDLCARLPYGVIVQFDGWDPEKLSKVDLSINIYNGMGGLPLPYLRPMSSMTEEEWEAYNKEATPEGVLVPLATEIDWLNAHHFDYRGLIEKGLALEAPKDMYHF